MRITRKITLAGSTLFIAAIVGMANDGMGIIERMRGPDEPQLPSEKAPQGEKAAGMALSATGADDPAPAGDQPAPAEVEGQVATPEDTLERAVARRLGEELELMQCSGLSVGSVRIDARFTPADAATSGFDSTYLEGSVMVRSDTGWERIELAGSGKGPAHEARSLDAVARSFSKSLATTELGTSCTKPARD